MTILRSALLTLVLFALLVGGAFGPRANAAPRAAAGRPTSALQPHYFVGAAPSASAAVPFAASQNPTPSAVISRQFARGRTIPLAAAHAQAQRVASARGLPVAQVLALIDQQTEYLTPWAQAQVNGPLLNRALDALY